MGFRYGYRRRSSYCRYCYNNGHNWKNCPQMRVDAADSNSNRHEEAKKLLISATTRHCSYCRRHGNESAGHTAAGCTFKKADQLSKYETAMQAADAICDVAANYGISIGSTFFAAQGVFEINYFYGLDNNSICKIEGFASEAVFDRGYINSSFMKVKTLPRNVVSNVSGYIFNDSLRNKIRDIRSLSYNTHEEDHVTIRKVSDVYFSTIAEFLINPPVDYEEAYRANIESLSDSIKSHLRMKTVKRTRKK